MKKIAVKIILILSFFLLINLKAQAQETSFENLISKTWFLEKFEENGKVLPPKKSHEEDKMIFNKDKTGLSISNNHKDEVIWSYDDASKIFNTRDKHNKIVVNFKVVEIDENKCILEFKNPKTGELMKIYMYPEKKVAVKESK